MKSPYEVFRLIGNIALNGKAKVEKGLNQIDKQSERVGKRFQEVGASVSATGRGMTKWVTGPIAALGGGLLALTKKTSDYADVIDKTSQRMGMSAEATQEWKFVGEQLGVELTSLERGLTRFQKRVGEADDGLSSAQRAFENLGVEIKDGEGNLRSMDDLFPSTIQKLADMEDVTKRNQLAMELFGRGGKELIPLLNQSGDNIEELQQKAHELGIVMGDEAVEEGVEWKDTLHEITEAGKGLFRQLGTELIPIFLDQLFPVIQNTIIPAVSDFIGLIADAATWFGNLSPPLQKIILGAVGLAAALGPVLMVLGPIISAVGTLMPLLGTMAGAIAGISAPALGTAAAIAGLVAAAVLVYRNWTEVKGALGAIWEYIKAQGENMSIGIQTAFHKMKQVTLDTINTMLEKLSVLESLPFGVGDKFAGMKDAISESADGSAEKIEELQKRAKENDKRIGEATENMGASFGDAGKAIANDVSGMIDTLNIFSTEAKASTEEQVDFAVDEYEYQTEEHGENAEDRTEKNAEEEEEQTEKTEEEAEERAEARKEFENKWSQKLRDETETRLEALEREKEKALNEAEKLGADRADIIKYFAIKEQKIRDEKAEKEEQRERKKLEKIESLEEEYSDKVFQETSTRIEQFEREKQEAIEKAEEIGASKEDIIKYYNLKITEEEEKQAEREQEIEEQKLEDKLAIEQKWEQKLFQQTATEEERLQREYEAALEEAEKTGADTYEIHLYYSNKIAELHEESRQKEKEAREQEAEEEEARREKEAEKRESIEQEWNDKLFELSASREERLQKEYNQAIEEAEEAGADTEDIHKYYAEKYKEIGDELIEEDQRRRQKEIEEERRKEQEKLRTREEFERKWSNKLFVETASRVEILEQEKQQALKKAKELGADKAEIHKYYEKQITKVEKNEAKERNQALRDSLSDYESALADTFSDVLKGTKSVTDAFQSLWDRVIDNVIDKLAEIAASKVFDWIIGGATGGGGGLLGGLFSGIGSLFGLATGAKVQKPIFAAIGEGPDEEAVLPLNKQVFSELAQGITEQMPQQQAARATGQRDIIFDFRGSRLMSENDMDAFMDRAVRYIKDVGGLSNDQ